MCSGLQRFNFSTNRSGWNCISAQVAAPKDFYSIQIGVFYGRNANTGMFSHISLTRELYGNVYTYDANGNVTAVKDLSNQKSAATYDSFDNLLSYVQPGSAATEKYLFTYGSAGNAVQLIIDIIHLRSITAVIAYLCHSVVSTISILRLEVCISRCFIERLYTIFLSYSIKVRYLRVPSPSCCSASFGRSVWS